MVITNSFSYLESALWSQDDVQFQEGDALVIERNIFHRVSLVVLEWLFQFSLMQCFFEWLEVTGPLPEEEKRQIFKNHLEALNQNPNADPFNWFPKLEEARGKAFAVDAGDKINAVAAAFFCRVVDQLQNSEDSLQVRCQKLEELHYDENETKAAKKRLIDNEINKIEQSEESLERKSEKLEGIIALSPERQDALYQLMLRLHLTAIQESRESPIEKCARLETLKDQLFANEEVINQVIEGYVEAEVEHIRELNNVREQCERAYALSEYREGLHLPYFNAHFISICRSAEPYQVKRAKLAALQNEPYADEAEVKAYLSALDCVYEKFNGYPPNQMRFCELLAYHCQNFEALKSLLEGNVNTVPEMKKKLEEAHQKMMLHDSFLDKLDSQQLLKEYEKSALLLIQAYAKLLSEHGNLFHPPVMSDMKQAYDNALFNGYLVRCRIEEDDRPLHEIIASYKEWVGKTVRSYLPQGRRGDTTYGNWQSFMQKSQGVTFLGLCSDSNQMALHLSKIENFDDLMDLYRTFSLLLNEKEREFFNDQASMALINLYIKSNYTLEMPVEFDRAYQFQRVYNMVHELKADTLENFVLGLDALNQYLQQDHLAWLIGESLKGENDPRAIFWKGLEDAVESFYNHDIQFGAPEQVEFKRRLEELLQRVPLSLGSDPIPLQIQMNVEGDEAQAQALASEEEEQQEAASVALAVALAVEG